MHLQGQRVGIRLREVGCSVRASCEKVLGCRAHQFPGKACMRMSVQSGLAHAPTTSNLAPTPNPGQTKLVEVVDKKRKAY